MSAAERIEGLIDAEQAALILGRTPRWIKDETAAGRIPSYKIGRQRRYRPSELERWLADRAEGERIPPVTRLDDRRR